MKDYEAERDNSARAFVAYSKAAGHETTKEEAVALKAYWEKRWPGLARYIASLRKGGRCDS